MNTKQNLSSARVEANRPSPANETGIAPRTFAMCYKCGATATLTTIEAQRDYLKLHACPNADEATRSLAFLNQRIKSAK